MYRVCIESHVNCVKHGHGNFCLPCARVVRLGHGGRGEKEEVKESWPETLRFESIPCTQNQSHSVSHADLLCLLFFFQICPYIFYVFPLLPHFLGGFILFIFNEVSFSWYLGNWHVLDTNNPFDDIVLIILFVFFENNYG